MFVFDFVTTMVLEEIYKFNGQTNEISIYTGETQNMGQGMSV